MKGMVITMNITEEMVEHLAELTKLTVSQDERVKLVRELEKILDYVEHMNEVDTEGVEPMAYITPMSNVFREDIVQNKDRRDQLLSNAPQQKDTSYVVPKTVD